MTLGPAPDYMSRDAVVGRRQRIDRMAAAVDAAVAATVRETLAAFGDVVDDDHQAEGEGRITVDVDGVGRVDVGVGSATVLDTTPPGWDHTPTVRRGDVLVSADGRDVVVITVLGTRSDPRPGFTLASIGRDGQGRIDPAGIGPTYTVGADGLHGFRQVDRIELG